MRVEAPISGKSSAHLILTRARGLGILTIGEINVIVNMMICCLFVFDFGIYCDMIVFCLFLFFAIGIFFVGCVWVLRKKKSNFLIGDFIYRLFVMLLFYFRCE